MNKNDPKLKPNIQLFADLDGKAQPENEPTAGDNTEPKQADIKDELEKLRPDNKLYENTLRGILGVADGEELGDINKRITDAPYHPAGRSTRTTPNSSARNISRSAITVVQDRAIRCGRAGCTAKRSLKPSADWERSQDFAVQIAITATARF